MASTTHDGDVAARLWTLSEQLTSRAHLLHARCRQGSEAVRSEPTES